MKSTSSNSRSVTLTLVAETGEQLCFELYDPRASSAASCVYAVLRTRQIDNPMRATYGQPDSKFCIIYVGETDDLAQRIEQHRDESWYQENGATHVCFYEESDAEARSELCSQLIRRYAPDCNSTRDAQIDPA